MGKLVGIKVSLSCLLTVALLNASCGSLFSDRLCNDLFRTDSDPQIEYSFKPHIPPEAQPVSQNGHSGAITNSTQPERQKPICPVRSDLLSVETVLVKAGASWADYLVSPDEQLMAFRDDKGVSILNLTTMVESKLTDVSESLLLWTDNRSIILAGQEGIYEVDLLTKERRNFEKRWEYNGPDLSQFDALFFTGWQASAALELEQEAICRFVREEKLQTTRAADGTLLIPRTELIEHGEDLIQQEYQTLLNYQEIAELRQKAGSISSVVAGETKAPIVHYYWPRLLILKDLPMPPYNLLIYASSESHWLGYADLKSQLTINEGGVKRWTTAHPQFYIAPFVCPKSGTDGYELALFQKATENSPAIESGRIPYPIAYGTRMDWSPQGKYIYFKQASAGNYSVTRLNLESFVAR